MTNQVGIGRWFPTTPGDILLWFRRRGFDLYWNIRDEEAGPRVDVSAIKRNEDQPPSRETTETIEFQYRNRQVNDLDGLIRRLMEVVVILDTEPNPGIDTSDNT